MGISNNDKIRAARDAAARDVIEKELRAAGSVKAAAAALGCARETLSRWCARLAIDVPDCTGATRTKTVTLDAKG